MDPDEALKQIGPHDVLRAFMMFMDQQENADFLKRASTKLSQNERRYAYIMYGLLNGMYEVDRSYKSNRALEHQIERVVMKKLSDEWLVSGPCDKAASIFMSGDAIQDGAVFGIKPFIKKWFDLETSHKILMDITDGQMLEKIYVAMSKSMKDDPIPEKDIYSLKEPITISVQMGEKTLETFAINRKADAKNFGKQIERLVKKEKEDFNSEGFKKYLADADRYKKFYRKNTDFIQDICGKNN
jgi:ADP-glucose pyrophosphorylase